MKRGWCPTVHAPMPTGDGLLVRVKPKFGRLTAAEARLIAHQSAACGNGIIELTGRGNLQIRGLDAASAVIYAAAMVGAGLASADAALEGRRNVTVSPLAGADPAVADDTLALAEAIETLLSQAEGFDGLPAKFAFAIDGGGALPLTLPAEVTLRSNGQTHWVNGTQSAGGLEAVMAQVRDCIRAGSTRRGAAPGAIAGFFGYPGSVRGAFALGLPFGQMAAAQLSSLADFSERFADGALRLSPWRAMLLGAIRATDAAVLTDAGAQLGLITAPADARLHMAACIGAAGCASGTVRTRDDAAQLARNGWSAQGDALLHVSGCAKGCAHPGPAHTTLVGESGRYNLVRGGSAADRPQSTGLTLAQIAGAL